MYYALENLFRIDLVLIVLTTTKTKAKKRHKKNFRGDEFFFYLDCGMVSWVYAYVQNQRKCTLNMYIFIFTYVLIKLF